ncbi:hypothetical protein FE697_019755 [Mumia zhuanghuii]|uniref:Uncharacterized protein n=1 Tax=Mumia zhuanghuii TaxID=2585211 RepID=A0A5Q6RQ10_9ACTN|nr:hypothetical protein FE697_019755 [Mumia zhuanghuii]
MGDGQPVAYETAKQLWAKSARDVLAETARKYGGDVTDEQLAAEVQRRTGVKTRVHVATWLVEVLDEVATDAHKRGEPALTALCVRESGRVGDSYRDVVSRLTGTPIPDGERHAAEQRFACYQRFGATLPADGGRPMPSRRVAASTSKPSTSKPVRRAPAPAKVERPVVVCPQCFMAVPATGVCDSCG